MNKFFFFTDTDLLQTQASEGAFGPVLSTDPDFDSGVDKYRLFSAHTASSNPLAYAICNGRILVQQDSTDPNLVNILLKPEVQPDIGLPKIKYYIYRGVLKNSLTDGTNVVNGGNTLTKTIIDNNPTSPQKILGIDLTGTGYSSTDPVDNAFYLPKTDFEFWKVYGGWSIGTFDKDGFGLEIVVEVLGFEIDFATARTHQNIFQITQLSGSPSQADAFMFKTQKEFVVNYLDPCAFFGNFHSSSLQARTSTDSTDADLIHSFNKKSGDEVYRDLIEGGTIGSPVNIFKNKNTVYLDVRNDQNHSMNYFENLGDDMKISYIDDNNEPITIVNYYSEGWPIARLETLPGGTISSSIRIAFPTFENMTPLVGVIAGRRKIKLGEKIKKGKSAFKNLTFDLDSSYTSDSLFLISPNYNSGPAVSQYIKLKYFDQGLIKSDPVNAYTPIRKSSLDFVFQPTAFNILFTTSDAIKLNVFDEDVYINYLENFGINYTSKVGIAKDSGNTILFWALDKRIEKKRFEAQSPSYSIVSSTDNSEQFFTKYISKSATPDSIAGTPVLITGNPVQLLREEARKQLFFKNKNNIDLDQEFGAIILSNSQFNDIVNLANTNFTSIYKPYLIAASSQNITADNNLPVLKIDLSLKGLADSGTGTMEFIEIPAGISIYSYPEVSLNN